MCMYKNPQKKKLSPKIIQIRNLFYVRVLTVQTVRQAMKVCTVYDLYDICLSHLSLIFLYVVQYYRLYLICVILFCSYLAALHTRKLLMSYIPRKLASSLKSLSKYVPNPPPCGMSNFVLS